jgi:hypothetical protein
MSVDGFSRATVETAMKEARVDLNSRRMKEFVAPEDG